MSSAAVRERIENLHRQAPAEAGEPAADAPPRPGDLFVLPQVGDLPVEWILIEALGGGEKGFRAAPADTHPLAGSRDLEVPAEHPGGPLTVRCGLSLELGPQHWPVEHRTGHLDAMTLGRIRRKVADLDLDPGRDSGVGAATDRAADVDHEAEYRLWMASLEEVVGRLAPTALRAADSEAVQAAAPWPSRRQLAWAASFLLAVSLALATVLVLQTAREGSPVVNAPFAVLTPLATVRGEPAAVAMAPDGPDLLLIFGLAGVPTFESYRLDMYDASGSKLLWSGGDLRRTGVAELSLTLPRAMLSSGEVRFSLLGATDASPEEAGEEPLARYALVLSAEP